VVNGKGIVSLLALQPCGLPLAAGAADLYLMPPADPLKCVIWDGVIWDVVDKVDLLML